MKTRHLRVVAIACCALPGITSAQDRPLAATSPAEQIVIKGDAAGPPVFLAFSPDGKELALLSMWGHALIDTSSWNKARRFEVGIRMLAYSPDGGTLATAEGTDGARLWNAADPGGPASQPADAERAMDILSDSTRVLLTPAQSARQRVFATAFSSDGGRILTTDAAGHVKVWARKSGKLEADVAQTTRPVRCAAFHPDGKFIAFGDDAGVLHVWDLEQQKTGGDHATANGAIGALSYSRDGKRLTTVHAAKAGPLVMI